MSQESKDVDGPLLPRFKNFPILPVVPGGNQALFDILLGCSLIPSHHTFPKCHRVANIIFMLIFLGFASSLTIIPLVDDIENEEFILISFFFWVVFLSRLLLYIKLHRKPGFPLCTNINISERPKKVLAILLTTSGCEKSSFIKLSKIINYYSIYLFLYLLFHCGYYSIYLSAISSDKSFETTMFSILGYGSSVNQAGFFIYVCFVLVKFESRLAYLVKMLHASEKSETSISIIHSKKTSPAPVAKIGVVNDDMGDDRGHIGTAATSVTSGIKNKAETLELQGANKVGDENNNKDKDKDKDYATVLHSEKEIARIRIIYLRYKFLHEEWIKAWNFLSLDSAVWQWSIGLFGFQVLVLIWLHIRVLIEDNRDTLFLLYGAVALSAIGMPAVIFVHFGHRLTMAFSKMKQEVLNKIQDIDDISKEDIEINATKKDRYGSVGVGVGVGVAGDDDNKEMKGVNDDIDDTIVELQKFRFYTILRNEMIENPLKCTMFNYEVSYKNFAISMATYGVVTIITQIISYVTSDW